MNGKPDTKKTILICLTLVLATAGIYYQVNNFSFVNYDDAEYVYQNPYIRNGLTPALIKWAFTTGYACFWHPLTWISHAMDRELYGGWPGGHHITSVLLHIANTLLIFLVFRKMTQAVWASAFAAALFALHPLHVESVAWVSERKDVLSTFFWLLTMWAYARYARRPGALGYLLVLAFFVMGMMSKPMLVTLPFVMLLLDWWPLNRITAETADKKNKIKWLIIEKTPLIAIAGVLSVVAYIAQKQGKGIPTGEGYALPIRIANACISYVQYIIKMVWPTKMSMFYPHPGKEVSFLYAGISVVILIAITILVIVFAKGHRYLLTGWFWYVGTLVPVIGIVQVGNHAMADRYSYITLTGLFIIIAWGLPELLSRWRYREAALWTGAIAVLAALGVTAHIQARYWKDTIALCEHALKVTDKNYRAHFCITLAMLQQGRFEETVEHASEAIRIEPKCYEGYNNLGVGLCRLGRFDEAINCYERLLEMKPDFALTRENLAAIFVTTGRYSEAVEQCKIVLETMDLLPTRKFLAYSLLKLGRYPEAIEEYRKILTITADDPEIMSKLGNALARNGEYDEAIAMSNKALGKSPGIAEAHINIGFALIGKGKFAEAVEEYDKALTAEPKNAIAHSEVGVALFKQGKLDEAIEHFKQAIAIDPNNDAAKTNLDFALAEKEKTEQKDIAGATGENIDDATN